MTLKMIDVDDKKWKAFRKHCNNKDTTMKAKLDKFLDKFMKVGTDEST